MFALTEKFVLYAGAGREALQHFMIAYNIAGLRTGCIKAGQHVQ